MLLVNARRGPSLIQGTGLIAREFIPKGTQIWRFMPGFDVAIPEAELARLPPASRQQAIDWSYFDLRTRTFVMSSDDDRFTNHSDSPNTAATLDGSIAIHDIHAGDEITIDYKELVVVNFPDINNYGVVLP
jgi:SET domain-containing protein